MMCCECQMTVLLCFTVRPRVARGKSVHQYEERHRLWELALESMDNPMLAFPMAYQSDFDLVQCLNA